ncbi:MAG: GTP cyclohydrolase II [Oxalobacteraceae bacterium]|jgi:GTP cyclohydrolase II|nr:GTP cyclohydrolase II [Oxalobacteraceae bacterium]
MQRAETIDTSSPVLPQIEHAASCMLPTPWASFRLHAFVEQSTGKEHLAMVLGDVGNGEPVLARLHSECLTGDTLFSQRCDCGAQLESALQRIADEGRGILLYLRQEGRGIGLVNKIRAYALQENGADTVEANHQLGFADDLRNYTVCEPMLAHFGIRALKLMTNNPRKLDSMKQLHIEAERVEHIAASTRFNAHYLATKASKLGHLLTNATHHSPTDDDQTS